MPTPEHPREVHGPRKVKTYPNHPAVIGGSPKCWWQHSSFKITCYLIKITDPLLCSQGCTDLQTRAPRKVGTLEALVLPTEFQVGCDPAPLAARPAWTAGSWLLWEQCKGEDCCHIPPRSRHNLPNTLSPCW